MLYLLIYPWKYNLYILLLLFVIRNICVHYINTQTIINLYIPQDISIEYNISGFINYCYIYKRETEIKVYMYNNISYIDNIILSRDNINNSNNE